MDFIERIRDESQQNMNGNQQDNFVDIDLEVGGHDSDVSAADVTPSVGDSEGEWSIVTLTAPYVQKSVEHCKSLLWYILVASLVVAFFICLSLVIRIFFHHAAE